MIWCTDLVRFHSVKCHFVLLPFQFMHFQGMHRAKASNEQYRRGIPSLVSKPAISSSFRGEARHFMY